VAAKGGPGAIRWPRPAGAASIRWVISSNLGVFLEFQQEGQRALQVGGIVRQGRPARRSARPGRGRAGGRRDTPGRAGCGPGNLRGALLTPMRSFWTARAYSPCWSRDFALRDVVICPGSPGIAATGRATASRTYLTSGKSRAGISQKSQAAQGEEHPQPRRGEEGQKTASGATGHPKSCLGRPKGHL